ncbi:hypothetical protein [Streptomyces sp. NPDC049813]|uniref:hypothetical protein n=1 Tax=Streptomyces sp. NPDC049813 TaxID=3365597 RepID=UPI003799A2D5
MTSTQTPASAPTGRRRRGLVPVPAESVRQPQQSFPSYQGFPPPQGFQQAPQAYQPHAPHPAHAAHQSPPAPQAPVPDPPLYRALLAAWAEGGRTLPGRHDPEWVRLVAPIVRTGQFSGTPDPRGDGR